jgi:hypothetical protein
MYIGADSVGTIAPPRFVRGGDQQVSDGSLRREAGQSLDISGVIFTCKRNLSICYRPVIYKMFHWRCV